MADKKKGSIVQFLLIFLIVYMGMQMFMRAFFPAATPGQNGVGAVSLKMLDATVKGQHHPEVSIRNKTEEDLVIEDRCPMPLFDVWKVEGEERTLLSTEEIVLPCESITSVSAGDQILIDLAPWKYSLFGEYGTYELVLPLGDGEGAKTSFSIHEAGSVTQAFRTFITKPLLNGLIFIASLMPGYNLGLAIIILTIIVKLILFLPTQHAMEGQKKMQLIQPKIEIIRKKYKNDPQRLNQETMKLWKQEKINPFQSCLPILLQFPVLIGLFFVIRDGSVLELSRHLLYESYQNLPWKFGTNFLGFDLTKPSVYVFPPLLVIMQFIQMKMSFAIASKKKAAQKKVVDVTPGKKKKKKDDSMESAMQTQQKVMMYGLPFMIGFFAIKFPAAVSLYWGVSTLFAIGQQIVVNREHLK